MLQPLMLQPVLQLQRLMRLATALVEGGMPPRSGEAVLERPVPALSGTLAVGTGAHHLHNQLQRYSVPGHR